MLFPPIGKIPVQGEKKLYSNVPVKAHTVEFTYIPVHCAWVTILDRYISRI